MRKLLVLAVCLACVATWASWRTQTVSNGTSNGSPALAVSSYQTTDILNLCVDLAGNDSNACTSQGACCLTPQGAHNKIPRLVRHPVTIFIDAGTYPGFVAQGLTFNPADTDAGAYLHVFGVLDHLNNGDGGTQNFVGQAVSGTAGSGSTFGTITERDDGGVGWQPNSMKGYLVETLAGTGSGQIRPVISNTAHTLTVAAAWTAPGAGTTFALRDWKTGLTSAAIESALPNAVGGNPAGIIVSSTAHPRDGASSTGIGMTLAFSRLWSGPATGNGVRVLGNGTSAGFANCKIASTAANTSGLSSSGVAGLSIAASVIQGQIGGVVLGQNVQAGAFNAGSGARVFASLIEGITSGSSTTGINANVEGLTFTGNQVSTLGTTNSAVYYVGGGTQATQIINNRFDCVPNSTNTSTGIWGPVAFSNNGPMYLGTSTNTFSNCGTAVKLASSGSAMWMTSTASEFVGNGVAIDVSKGAKLIYTVPTITSPTDGGTTTQISMDGVTYTFAQLTGMSDGGTLGSISNLAYGTSVGP